MPPPCRQSISARTPKSGSVKSILANNLGSASHPCAPRTSRRISILIRSRLAHAPTLNQRYALGRHGMALRGRAGGSRSRPNSRTDSTCPNRGSWAGGRWVAIVRFCHEKQNSRRKIGVLRVCLRAALRAQATRALKMRTDSNSDQPHASCLSRLQSEPKKSGVFPTARKAFALEALEMEANLLC